MNEMTRADFLEQMAAFERRINERFDLLERLMALGFDDTGDQIRLGVERFVSTAELARTSLRDLSHNFVDGMYRK